MWLSDAVVMHHCQRMSEAGPYITTLQNINIVLKQNISCRKLRLAMHDYE